MNELLSLLRNLSPSDRRALLILAGCGVVFAGFFALVSVRSARHREPFAGRALHWKLSVR